MIPEVAVIKTEGPGYKYSKKICGLYPLERNILILSTAGVKKIYLDISEEERDFYDKKIKNNLKRLVDTEIYDVWSSLCSLNYLLIPSNLFTQVHYFSEFSDYFTESENVITPILRDDHFLLLDDVDFINAESLTKGYIISSTDGYIAKNINKRISIPFSILLSKTRIHPNILTFINMIIGVLSAVFLLFNSYWHIVLGGFFFQLASVMDGVDGEVAKFTFKVSDIGGWLDTISDNLTFFLFISAASYLYHINSGRIDSVIFIMLIFIGSTTMLFIMIRYLRRYSSSRSLVAYDKEFIQKLPRSDPLIAFIQLMKYTTKKDFFALFFFGVSLTGRVYLIIPIAAITLMIASTILVIVDLKYKNTLIKDY